MLATELHADALVGRIGVGCGGSIADTNCEGLFADGRARDTERVRRNKRRADGEGILRLKARVVRRLIAVVRRRTTAE